MLSASDLAILGRVALAAALGLAIGLERMAVGAPVPRAHSGLVAMTTAMLTAVSVDAYGLESSRVVQGLVTGMGFLGAGIILHSAGGQIHGLTTAAGLWAVGGVGIVVGSGRVLLGVRRRRSIYAFVALSDSPLIRWALQWGAEHKAARPHGRPPGRLTTFPMARRRSDASTLATTDNKE